MSVSALKTPGTSTGTATDRERPAVEPEPVNYLNVDKSISSWLLTGDHKRIAIMYLIGITVVFFLGAAAIGMVRFELTAPKGQILSSESYNKMFSAHGILMVFFFLVPSIPATLGNFLVPLMIGARDLAFPRLNLLSFYLWFAGAMCTLAALTFGGVDTGWTFYTPYSSIYANGNVSLALVGIFIAGFSSIATGVNFIVTIHKMRAPGMTWFRLPLFIWSMYTTSVIIILGTPVVAITLLLVVLERTLGLGIFSPELGGDPVLFQHMFWFYSHPAVYIMVLPSLGVNSELVAVVTKKRIFGYPFVAFSSLAIGMFGFIVWGHHMFATTQSMYSSLVFSVISFLVAIPSAIKVFNWMATMYKGSVEMNALLIYSLSFIGLFVIGGLTGLFLSSLAMDVHLTATYFVVAHFHYIMVGGSLTGFIGGLHYWWPKMTGRMYPEFWARVAAIVLFIGFNVTFFPQFILGYIGMPRRYHFYAPEYQVWHVASSLGASILAVGMLIPAFYFLWSLKYGKIAGSNPWGAIGLEWETTSPPLPQNFAEVPIVTWEAYEYSPVDHHAAEVDRDTVGVTRDGSVAGVGGTDGAGNRTDH